LDFYAFWFANSGNSFWHSIIVRDWLVKAVTISSEMIKQAVTFQLGVAGAILAALALERFQVPLPQLASISIMRAGTGSGQLLFLSRKIFHRHFFNSKKIGMTGMVFVATTILGLIQAISVVLVSDIGLSSIPGKSNSTELNIGFTYYSNEQTNAPQTEILTRGTTWSRKPPFYPTFAEYSEPPFVSHGVDDTGLTLRAFLPFPAAQDRQTIRTYSGKTTVLDARVTCQVPILSNETIKVLDTETLLLEGSFQASTIAPRLQNSIIGSSPSPSGSVFRSTYNESVPFQCYASTSGLSGFNLVNSSQVNRWRLAICQLGAGFQTGGLSSEFVADVLPAVGNFSAGFEESEAYGAAYLILNVTLGSSYTWDAVAGGTPVAPPEYSQNGEWLDLVYSKGDLVLGVTVCYSAFRTADIPVLVSSNFNRTEPAASFDLVNSMYTFSEIRNQLGQGPDPASLEDRGVLQLEKKPSWIADASDLPPVEPFVRDFANMQGQAGGTSGMAGNYTAILWQASPPSQPTAQQPQFIAPDPMHVWLVQEMVSTGASVAFALQSIITVLSRMAYYDQIAQFNNNQTAEVDYFVIANTPQRYWGLLAVCTVLLLHIILLLIVVTVFARESRFSMLGNTWQGLSQAVTEETRDHLSIASMMTDSEVEEKMKQDGVKRTVVGLEKIDGSRVVGVVRRVGNNHAAQTKIRLPSGRHGE
jgi:hypothetical protein